MMIFLLMFFSVNSVFAQVSDNIKPYISSDYIGLQANPVLTGVKSSVKNQETEFNITLFYHDKYDLHDDEVLGMIEGRLISEKAISSFDLIAQLQKDEALSLLNIENQRKAYEEYLEKFQEFQWLQHSNTNDTNDIKATNHIIHGIAVDSKGKANIVHLLSTEIDTNSDIIHVVSIDRRGNTNISHAIVDEKGKTHTIPVVDTDMDVIHTIEIDDDGITNVIHTTINTDEATTDEYSDETALSYIKQKFVARSITNIQSLISDEELKQLIRMEMLKDEYNKLLELYNAMASQQMENTFDPADPSERFTVTIMGEDNISTVWSKSFSLDGVDNYQSYDKSVWFLGYKLLITKRDVRMLYNIFTQNKRVKYMVTGVNGTIEFSLSPYFIDAIKELMTLYAHGKFKTERSMSFPLLRE